MVEFDDIARVVGYLTIGWWVLMILLVIIVLFMGKATATKEHFAEFLSEHRGGCRMAGGRPCPA